MTRNVMLCFLQNFNPIKKSQSNQLQATSSSSSCSTTTTTNSNKKLLLLQDVAQDDLANGKKPSKSILKSKIKTKIKCENGGQIDSIGGKISAVNGKPNKKKRLFFLRKSR